MSKKISQERLAKIESMIALEYTYLEISRICHVSSQTLAKYFGPSRYPIGTNSVRRDRSERYYSKEIKTEARRLRREEKKTNGEIAKILNVKKNTILHWMGGTPNSFARQKRWPIGYPQRARYLASTGRGATEIGRELGGVPRQTVQDWIKDRADDHRRRVA